MSYDANEIFCEEAEMFMKDELDDGYCQTTWLNVDNLNNSADIFFRYLVLLNISVHMLKLWCLLHKHFPFDVRCLNYKRTIIFSKKLKTQATFPDLEQ